MLKFILDPKGDNTNNSDAITIDCEAGFIRHLRRPELLFVKGENLCNWACDYATARKLHVKWLSSPIDELLHLCPVLSKEEAIDFIEHIESEGKIFSRPIDLKELVTIRWPNDLWNHNPSVEHAFNWLIWLCCSEVVQYEEKISSFLSDSWVDSEVEWSCKCYKATKQSAWGVLREWLKIGDSKVDWPLIPKATLPNNIELKLIDNFKRELIESNGNFVLKYILRSVNKHYIKLCVDVSLDYFEFNNQNINKHIIDKLKPYLSSAEYNKLLKYIPAEDPGLPPKIFSEISDWFINAYLPYRLKTANSKKIDDVKRLNELASAFALWFLEFYSEARSGSVDADHLSWAMTSNLDKTTDQVTLLVVLDGLSYVDSDYLQKIITDKSDRLTLDNFQIAVSPIPTITQYAKPSLLKGVNPKKAIEEKEAQSVGVYAKKIKDVLMSLNTSSNGEIVIWSLVNPDSIYHKGYDGDALKSHVEGWLQGFAQLLVDVLHQVDSNKSINLIVTTDHGRLLSCSQKTYEVPPGTEVHGRVALGDFDVKFGKEGYVIEKDIVYLHPDRFGLESVCAVALSDQSFIPPSGTKGQLPYPHGGLFPEEVLIPWMRFSRDTGEFSFTAELGGTGVAGSAGCFVLEVTNSSRLHITVNCVRFSNGKTIVADLTAFPMKKSSLRIDTSKWPTKEDKASLTAYLEYSLPNGESRRELIAMTFDVEQMYEKPDILGDW